MEQVTADGRNAVQHKYSNDPNFEGKPHFQNSAKNVHAQDIVFLRDLKKGIQNNLISLIFKKKLLTKQ